MVSADSEPTSASDIWAGDVQCTSILQGMSIFQNSEFPTASCARNSVPGVAPPVGRGARIVLFNQRKHKGASYDPTSKTNKSTCAFEGFFDCRGSDCSQQSIERARSEEHTSELQS